MSKTLEINGITFEVEKALAVEPNTSHITLEDCYTKCSETKKEIWRDWFNWFIETSDEFMMWVSSHNCNIFTISAVATINGQRYFFHITPAHNRIALINA